MKSNEYEQKAIANDHEILKQLNEGYVRSVQDADVEWFNEHLAPDFMNTNPDTSIVDRVAFLVQIARGVNMSNLAAEDVFIRVMGDLAIIHARTTYKTPSNSDGHGRYTDIWLRKAGRWLCVAAQVNRS
jgi:ketosteroid isomerase-like protein